MSDDHGMGYLMNRGFESFMRLDIFEMRSSKCSYGLPLLPLCFLRIIQDNVDLCSVIGLDGNEVPLTKSKRMSGLIGIVVIRRDVSNRKEILEGLFLMDAV